MRNLDVVWLGWPASFVAGTVIPYFCFQNALILVGKNNTGKSSILHALRAVEGSYEISLDDFNETMQNIEIGFILSITEEDLHIFHKNGMVSQYKKYDLWKKDFESKLPSYKNEEITFTFK